MHISARSRRFGGLLIALGAVLATFASTATAALAVNLPLPDGRAAGTTGVASLNRGGIYDPVQTSPAAPVVVVGGMPGWQIALIAVGAALVAAVVAVLAYRAWTARRPSLTAPRFGSPAHVAGGK
jgi:uncharacterized membrane protein YedE/YeeE